MIRACFSHVVLTMIQLSTIPDVCSIGTTAVKISVMISPQVNLMLGCYAFVVMSGTSKNDFRVGMLIWVISIEEILVGEVLL